MPAGYWGGRPLAGSLLILSAALVAALVAVASEREALPPEPVEYATTEDLERALDHALSRLPRPGSRQETPADRDAREVIVAATEGRVIIEPGRSAPSSTTTTSTSTTVAPTTTTTTAPRGWCWT